jgi:hypothetical protein
VRELKRPCRSRGADGRHNEEDAEKDERGKRFRHMRTVWQSRTAAQSGGTSVAMPSAAGGICRLGRHLAVST